MKKQLSQNRIVQFFSLLLCAILVFGPSAAPVSADHEHTTATTFEPLPDGMDGCRYEIVYCTDCGDELSREIIMVHNTQNSVSISQPTCNSGGSVIVVKYCIYCDYKQRTEVRGQPLGHSWDDGVITDPTCTEPGARTFTCTRDNNHTKTEEIPALGHTHGEPVQENIILPECPMGSPQYDSVTYCTVCGDELSRNVVPGISHDPHTMADVVTPPTCTEVGGYDEVTSCEREGCKAVLHRNHITIPALGHDWGEWKEEKAATAQEEGIEKRICKNDPSHTETRAIPRLDDASDKPGDEPGDGDVPNDGDEPGDNDAPDDGDVPGDNDAPDDGDEQGDNDAPDDGDVPGDNDAPDDGDVPGDNDAPADGDAPDDGDVPSDEPSDAIGDVPSDAAGDDPGDAPSAQPIETPSAAKDGDTTSYSNQEKSPVTIVPFTGDNKKLWMFVIVFALAFWGTIMTLKKSSST